MAGVAGQATHLQLVRRPAGVPGPEDWELASARLLELTPIARLSAKL